MVNNIRTNFENKIGKEVGMYTLFDKRYPPRARDHCLTNSSQSTTLLLSDVLVARYARLDAFANKSDWVFNHLFNSIFRSLLKSLREMTLDKVVLVLVGGRCLPVAPV